MATISEVQLLCTALTNETQKGSISPARLGSLLTNIVTLISNEVDRAAGKATTLAGYGITDAVQKVTGKGLSTDDYKDPVKKYTVWESTPEDNTQYILGEKASLVLSTNGLTPDACAHGTTIYFTSPTSAPTTIVFKDNTVWSGDAPEIEAGGYYCICILEGVYSLINLTYQSN